MSDVGKPNIYSKEWQRSIEQGRFGVRGTQVGRQAGCEHVGVSVYELDPGKTNMPYHTHFGVEEVLVVLRGTPDAIGHMLPIASEVGYFEGED